MRFPTRPGLPFAPWSLLLAVACAPSTGDTADSAAAQVDCEAGSRGGSPDGETNVQTPDGVGYDVYVPEGYDPTVFHPLVVVYSPAGGNRVVTESFTGLTGPLTEAGFLVAYVDHVTPRSVEAVEPLAEVPAGIVERWCVDPERVHLTGHSDGGTIASVLAAWGYVDPPAASVAPSAAGITAGVLEQTACPAPTPVLVVHSINDGLFHPSEGFGEGAARWWAACNGCQTTLGGWDDDGCRTYEGCPAGAEVRYCPHQASHGTWAQQFNPVLVNTFEATAD